MDYFNEIWTYPTSDLEKIYHSMNLTKETSSEINKCCLTMFGGSILEKYISGLIKTNFEQKAAFLTEEVDLWYHGGIEDMSTHVSWKWQHLQSILTHLHPNLTNTSKETIDMK